LGEECTFDIEANCGAPSFTFSPLSTVDPAKVGVSFYEYNANKLKFFRGVPLTPSKEEIENGINLKLSAL
jgi:hypothetical protein